jgi:hypothetical protein
MIPQKLQPGDEIRVIAPARSLEIIQVKDSYYSSAIARVSNGLKKIASRQSPFPASPLVLSVIPKRRLPASLSLQ